MQKHPVSVLEFIAIAFILAGCGSRTVEPAPPVKPFQVQTTDIVQSVTGAVSNTGRFTAFLHHVQLRQPDHVRIVVMTSEGDPIITTLDYNGTVIDNTVDNSLDRFGGTSKGRSREVCTSIVAHTSKSGTAYDLIGCTNPSLQSHVLFIPAPPHDGE